MGRKLLLSLVLLAPAGTYYCYNHLNKEPDDVPPIKEDRLISKPEVLSQQEKEVRNLIASLAVLPGQPFPSLLCWEPLRVIGQKKVPSLEDIARERPLEFIEVCMKRYEENVQGYRLTFLKRERIDGELQKQEKLLIHFREKPFSVHMEWQEGARLAARSLYVEGENKGKLLAMPIVRFLGVLDLDVDSRQAKKSGRYTINHFGIYLGTKRTMDSARRAEKAGTLNLRYDGLVQLELTGNRPCYKLVRSPYQPPEDDNIGELVMYFDQETLLQVGSVLRDPKGNVIAEYFFRNIELNPKFDAKQFSREGL